MSDEDNIFGGFTPAAPVLPSRATGEAKPLTPLPQAEEPRRRKPRAAPKKAAPKRKAVAKPRSKTVPMTKKRVRAINRAAKAATPKNPNRPLEAKFRLHQVLDAVTKLSKPESSAFAAMMAQLENLAGPARKRVIGALAQVYE